MKTTSQPRPEAVPARWRWHYHTLMRVRAGLMQQHHSHTVAFRTLRGGNVHDALDVAGDLQDQDELLTELAAEEVELTEVDAALERLRAGTYGVCEATGALIPARRLRVLPWTRFTQAAAARREFAAHAFR